MVALVLVLLLGLFQVLLPAHANAATTRYQDGKPYAALDAEISVAHYVPSTGTSAFTDFHGTLLLPQGQTPPMLLVTLLAQTVAADGTSTITLTRSYTACLGVGPPQAR